MLGMVEASADSDTAFEMFDPFEQVYCVLFSRSPSVSVSEITSNTGLTRSTVETHLETLCEMEIATVDASRPHPVYQFNDGSLTRQTARRLHTERDPAELKAIDETLASQEADWRAEYDVSSPRACLRSTKSGYIRTTSIPPVVLREWLFVAYYRRLLRCLYPPLADETDSTISE